MNDWSFTTKSLSQAQEYNLQLFIQQQSAKMHTNAPAVIVCYVRHPCTYCGTHTEQPPTHCSATVLAALVLRHFALQVPCQCTLLASLHPLIFGLTSFGELRNEKPTWCHLLFYFIYYALNMFRTLIYPSSGACDCVDELPHRSSCS